MSPGNEQDIRQLLGGVLDTITPSPVPASTVLRKGRVLRRRRRVGSAAGAATALAAVAVATAVIPGLLHQGGHQPPVSRQRNGPAVTVHPPGRHSPAGEIAWGTVNGRRWQLITTRSGAISVAGASAAAGSVPMSPAGPDPISLGALGGTLQAYYGAVRRDVTSVEVTLGDGSKFRLQPVTVFGHRLIGFETPLREAVGRIVAYSGHRELAYAIPYNGAGVAMWGVMLRPGQAEPPRLSRTIFSGRVTGTYHRVTVHLGPWGRCLTDSAGSSACSPASPGPAASAGVIMRTAGPGQPGLLIGALQPSVKAMVLTMAGGGSVSVPLDAMGSLKFYALVITGHPRILSWATFGGAGNQIDGGQGAPS